MRDQKIELSHRSLSPLIDFLKGHSLLPWPILPDCTQSVEEQFQSVSVRPRLVTLQVKSGIRILPEVGTSWKKSCSPRDRIGLLDDFRADYTSSPARKDKNHFASSFESRNSAALSADIGESCKAKTDSLRDTQKNMGMRTSRHLIGSHQRASLTEIQIWSAPSAKALRKMGLSRSLSRFSPRASSQNRFAPETSVM